MTAWASPSDVQGRWIGDDAPDDSTLLTVLIGDAQRYISSEYPDTQARLDAGSLTADAVTQVVCGIVIRLLRNPEGLRSEMEQTGPFLAQVSYAAANPGALYLTPQERSLLTGRKDRGAFTINPAMSAGVHVTPNGDPFWNAWH